MDQATSRLRKTFRYPAENDSDDSLPEAMDEEEQENLITTLTQRNTTQNTLYKNLLLSLPLICLIPYTLLLFTPSSVPKRKTTILSIMSITSLLSTTFMIHDFPAGKTGIPLFDNLNEQKGRAGKENLPKFGSITSGREESPIRRYLPYLNILLCSILGILGMLTRNRLSGSGGELGDNAKVLGFLPGFIYGAVLAAKYVMGGVDPERELGELRYRYKGA